MIAFVEDVDRTRVLRFEAWKSLASIIGYNSSRESRGRYRCGTQTNCYIAVVLSVSQKATIFLRNTPIEEPSALLVFNG